MAKEKIPPLQKVADPPVSAAMTPEAEAFARLIGEFIAAKWRKMNAGDRAAHTDRRETQEPPPTEAAT